MISVADGRIGISLLSGWVRWCRYRVDLTIDQNDHSALMNCETEKLSNCDVDKDATISSRLYEYRTRLINPLLVICLFLLIFIPHTKEQAHRAVSIYGLEQCAWKTLQHQVGILDVQGISSQEYLERQEVLAQTLVNADVDALIVEPSATSEYYFNVSRTYELSERPFLIILDNSGQVSYLVPKFEVNRIKRLNVVAKDIKYIEWQENESPYKVLVSKISLSTVMVDEHLRYMIAAGLEANGVKVVAMSRDVQTLRSVKSKQEIEILQAVNHFTVEVVRSMQKCLVLGTTQGTLMTTAEHLFSRAGIGAGFWAIVLFGNQAADPHGGSLGRTLSPGEFILIDIGSSLHGYGSDITRTILPPRGEISDDLLQVWHTVYDAQTAAIDLMRVNVTAREVDIAARQVIVAASYGEFFTHRLGHGIVYKILTNLRSWPGNARTSLPEWSQRRDITAWRGCYERARHLRHR